MHGCTWIEAVGGSSIWRLFLKLADFALKSLLRRTIAIRGVLCGVPVISRHEKRPPGDVVVPKSTQMAVLQCEWAVARAFGRGTGSKERSVDGAVRFLARTRPAAKPPRIPAVSIFFTRPTYIYLTERPRGGGVGAMANLKEILF